MSLISWTQTDLAQTFNNLTLGSFLRTQENSLSETDRYVCRLWINDTLIDSETEAEMNEVIVAQFLSIKIQTSGQIELISNTIISLLENLSSVHAKAKTFIEKANKAEPTSFADGQKDIFDQIMETFQDINEALIHLKPVLFNDGYLTEPADWDRAEIHFKALLNSLFETFFRQEFYGLAVVMGAKLHYSLDLWRVLLESIQNRLEQMSQSSEI